MRKRRGRRDSGGARRGSKGGSPLSNSSALQRMFDTLSCIGFINEAIEFNGKEEEEEV